ncbi:MAG: hypothetical protein ACOC3S_03795 [Bacteroidota bacterium]
MYQGRWDVATSNNSDLYKMYLVPNGNGKFLKIGAYHFDHSRSYYNISQSGNIEINLYNTRKGDIVGTGYFQSSGNGYINFEDGDSILRMNLTYLYDGDDLKGPLFLGNEFKYHDGISDIETITGRDINIAELRNVPMYIYKGELDDNDCYFHQDHIIPDLRTPFSRILGPTPIERWPNFKKIYETRGLTNAHFVLYPGVGHEITEQMEEDVVQFFSNNRNYNLQDAQNCQIMKIIPEDSSRDFHFPYYLLIPQNPMPSNAVLMVESNNTSYNDDDFSVHDQSAYEDISGRCKFARELNTPFLMPVFPRITHPDDPGDVLDCQTLNDNCLTTDIEGWQRVDLQLIEMINDARERLAEFNIVMDERVFMTGYSSGGTFANRFAVLHPEIVKAAAIGGLPNPILPVSHWPPEMDLEMADSLFDWLESQVPEILFPAPQKTLQAEGILARCYPGLDVAIGIVIDDFYYLDETGILHNLGPVEAWLEYVP